jgi:hypothetical protein
MRGSKPGTEKLTLRHLRAAREWSKGRGRFHPLRVWDFILILVYGQVDTEEATQICQN